MSVITLRQNRSLELHTSPSPPLSLPLSFLYLLSLSKPPRIVDNIPWSSDGIHNWFLIHHYNHQQSPTSLLLNILLLVSSNMTEMKMPYYRTYLY